MGAASLALAAGALLPVAEATASPTPEVGQPCSGAEIGRKVTDSAGRTIICNNYRWQIFTDQQRPSAGQLRRYFNG